MNTRCQYCGKEIAEGEDFAAKAVHRRIAQRQAQKLSRSEMAAHRHRRQFVRHSLGTDHAQ